MMDIFEQNMSHSDPGASCSVQKKIQDEGVVDMVDFSFAFVDTEKNGRVFCPLSSLVPNAANGCIMRSLAPPGSRVRLEAVKDDFPATFVSGNNKGICPYRATSLQVLKKPENRSGKGIIKSYNNDKYVHCKQIGMIHLPRKLFNCDVGSSVRYVAVPELKRREHCFAKWTAISVEKDSSPANDQSGYCYYEDKRVPNSSQSNEKDIAAVVKPVDADSAKFDCAAIRRNWNLMPTNTNRSQNRDVNRNSERSDAQKFHRSYNSSRPNFDTNETSDIFAKLELLRDPELDKISQTTSNVIQSVLAGVSDCSANKTLNSAVVVSEAEDAVTHLNSADDSLELKCNQGGSQPTRLPMRNSHFHVHASVQTDESQLVLYRQARVALATMSAEYQLPQELLSSLSILNSSYIG